MAENTSLIALINAYIKRNSNQEITGPVLNGVLRAIAYALSTPFIGEDGYWYAYNAETGVFEKTDTPAQGPVGPVGVTEAGASIDSSIGTPSVEVSLNGTRLDFSFHNLKGQKGDAGNPGITNAVVTVDATIGTPSVSANIQDTTLYLAFSGLKGEQGLQGIQGVSIQSVQQVTTSIQSGGTNVIRVTLDNGQTFDFQVMNGQQGNSGYQGAAGELEVVNNLTDGGATKALSAEMGKTLKGDVDQLEAKVSELVTHHTETISLSGDLAVAAGGQDVNFYGVNFRPGRRYSITVESDTDNTGYFKIRSVNNLNVIVDITPFVTQNINGNPYTFVVVPTENYGGIDFYIRSIATAGTVSVSAARRFFVVFSESGAVRL